MSKTPPPPAKRGAAPSAPAKPAAAPTPPPPAASGYTEAEVAAAKIAATMGAGGKLDPNAGQVDAAAIRTRASKKTTTAPTTQVVPAEAAVAAVAYNTQDLIAATLEKVDSLLEGFATNFATALDERIGAHSDALRKEFGEAIGQVLEKLDTQNLTPAEIEVNTAGKADYAAIRCAVENLPEENQWLEVWAEEVAKATGFSEESLITAATLLEATMEYPDGVCVCKLFPIQD